MREAIKKYKAKLKGEGGFTLIELMAVLAILALIAIIAVPAIGSILQKAGDNADASDVDMIEKAAGIAYVADGGTEAGLKATGTKAEPKNTAAADLSYSVDYLVKAGFLDYDNTAKDARNGTVKLQKDGTFNYVKASGEPNVNRGE